MANKNEDTYVFKDLIVLYLISACTYVANLCFSDLSLQDSLLQEYKKVCSVRSVRIVPSGRSGRYAVIYLAPAGRSELDRALDETRSPNGRIQTTFSQGSPPLEADIYLAPDDLTQDDK